MPSPTSCLLPKQADALAEKLKSGELDALLKAGVSSAERRAAFAKIVGEANAEHVNAQFESKLLLKNQQQGIQNWIEQAGRLKPEVKRDMLARVARMDKVLEPKDMDSFLADLAKQKLGFGVTMEEAGTIVGLSKAVADAKALPLLPDGSRPVAYGDALINFGDYVSDLKNGARPRTVWGGIKTGAGVFKSVISTLDDSIIGRQGLNTLFTNPDVWAVESLKTFQTMYKTLKGVDVQRAQQARLLSSKNAELYRRGKVALGNLEEQFPSSLPEKVPVLGKLYKANEAAFTVWQREVRAKVFDKYVDVAQRSGVDLTTSQLEQFGSIVNSLTGRGHLGKAEVFADEMNLLLFSGRKIAADLDVLTGHQLRNLADRASGGEGYSKLSQRIAAENLAKIVVGTAALMVMTEKMFPGSTEENPTSSAFGTIETTVEDNADVALVLLADMLGFGSNTYAGKTNIDITGGKRGIITLAARIAAKSTKNSRTGDVTPLYKGGFSQKEVHDLLADFLNNKKSPAVALIWAMYTQQQRNGKPLTLESLAKENAPVPASVRTALELLDARKGSR